LEDVGQSQPGPDAGADQVTADFIRDALQRARDLDGRQRGKSVTAEVEWLIDEASDLETPDARPYPL
jgi:hypothetical protein